MKSLLHLQRALAASRDTLLASYNSSLLFKLLQQRGDKKKGSREGTILILFPSSYLRKRLTQSHVVNGNQIDGR